MELRDELLKDQAMLREVVKVSAVRVGHLKKRPDVFNIGTVVVVVVIVVVFLLFCVTFQFEVLNA